MIYGLLRRVAGVALRWYYRDVRVLGLERVPRDGPLLVAPNHPNALVDALLAGVLVPRRLLITAKATLFANPVAGWALRGLGVLPLRRAADERARRAGGGAPDASRNEDTFRAVLDALRDGGAVLMFPEGKSWDEPHLAPLRTGAARIALQARERGVRGLSILPVGLVFEEKDRFRSRVLIEVGEPIAMDDWTAGDARSPVQALTDDLAARLHAVTLNYPSVDTALRERDLAALFAAVREDHAPVSSRRPLDADVALARRIAAGRELLATTAGADAALDARVDALLARADAFDAALSAANVRVEDIALTPRTLPGARFVAREGMLLAVGLPVAAWGRVHHWLPLRLIARLARGGTSRADPAMRAIVAGLVVLVAWYTLAWIVVRALGGSALGATAYVVSLPIALDFALRYQERLRRARERTRAYLTFRRDPALQARLRAERDALREESFALERAVLGDAGR